ncbi:MAG: SDR family NAD(P)-dependent oxidoreductase [Steroidobacteraceae bacterium]|jgi:NAD(P)-dependent dehydrogenase (short-subunit alcohol dehydrogenase family)
MEGLLAGRVILVTGASSGIGLAALDVFSREGAVVLGIARRTEPAAATVAALVAAGRRVAIESADVTRPGEVERVITLLETRHGPLDGAFNNAAMTQDAVAIDLMDEATLDQLFEINVKGTWRCLRAELKAMRPRRKGVIVNTSSIAGVRGFPGLSAYCASKHAVIGLTRSAALDAAEDGIRVNALCPGTTRTPMMERQMQTRPGGEQATLQRIPLARISESEEQAEAAAWLLSWRSSFVTGESLVVDGGATIR